MGQASDLNGTVWRGRGRSKEVLGVTPEQAQCTLVSLDQSRGLSALGG